ncbi:MAG: helix-turn-helix transcriptional regulator [Gammaproteobacteria bacterium]|nr:helix-turn-helix transcriptional regulator [Gammaproteobacteria bacterium]
MLAIPLPFVMSLLLVIVVILLIAKQPIEGKIPALFITLCAVSTLMVGLRWTYDVAIFRFLQPILASLLPVTAWYCFAKAHNRGRISILHLTGPIAITICSFWFQFWIYTIDAILTVLYFCYGAVLIRYSFSIPQDVRLSDAQRVITAERIAGIMLVVSGCIDGVLSFDFIAYAGKHALDILSLAYLFLIPTVVVGVIIVSFSTISNNSNNGTSTGTEELSAAPHNGASNSETDLSCKAALLPEADANNIVSKMETLMAEQEVFRDPNLSLGRLSRKIGIPARQVSMAVNQVYTMNISKVLNEYRINYAKKLLVNTDDSITDIYLSAGFQTKSNFNREFARITGITPSVYRSDPTMLYVKEKIKLKQST